MTIPNSRRAFLAGAAAVAAAGRAWGQRPEQAKLDRFSVMSLCFSPLLKSVTAPDDPKRTIDILDLAGVVAERWGIHCIELQHSHIASTEPQYLAEFRSRLKKAGSRMNQINLEFGNLNISTPEPVRRLETIDLTKQWIDHAVALGCPRVMVNQGTLAPEVRQSAIETLKTINGYAKTKKIFVTMENRGMGPARASAGAAPARAGAAPAPQTAGWDTVVEVIKAAGIYANPDWLWFPDEEARTAGLKVMYQMTSGSSHCRLDPERFSSAQCIKIAKEAGYKGLYSIETARNNGPDPYAAVQSILDVALANV